MIDIHSHILWGLDDGAKSIEDSLDIAVAAEKDGIHAIIATPHYIEGSYETRPDSIKKKAADLNKKMEAMKLDLEIIAGHEIYLSTDTGQKLEDGRLLALGQSRYVLVEFPMMAMPDYAERALYEIMRRGYMPIIAHPERIASAMGDMDRLAGLINRGCLVQVNSMSIEGGFGKRAQEAGQAMADRNMIHFIASDAHDSTGRGPALSGAFKKLEKRGCGHLLDKSMKNAQAVIDNEYIEIEEPLAVRKRRTFLGGIFPKTRKKR